MSPTPPRYVCIEPNGSIWQHVGNETETVAVLRSTTETYDYPGHRLHGTPAEIRCPLSWLIPVTHSLTEAGADFLQRRGAGQTAVGAVVGAAPTASRTTDPPAAHDAASVAAATVTFAAWLVLAAHVAAGAEGCTGDELAKTCGRKYEAVGPRRKPLERSGAIALSDLPKRKGKGVYVATEAGRAAWLLAPVSIVPAVKVSLTATASGALKDFERRARSAA